MSKTQRTHVAVIGIGLLGGSLALALRKAGGFRLTGWSPSASTRRQARRFLRVAPGLEPAVMDADVVVIGSPSASVVPVLARILPHLRQDALVVDMASVKGAVASTARRLRGAERHFVPCHSMAGKEKSGARFADPGLFRGKTVFLTPLPGNPSRLVGRAERFWRGIGAVPVRMTPAAHDARVAVTSHAPHLVACLLMERFDRAASRDAGIRRAVGPGFRDVTRIAASSPAMWTDIVSMNARELGRNLAGLRRRLGEMEKDLRRVRPARWARFFAKVKAAREKL